MRRRKFIVPRTSLQANIINFIWFYIFSVGTSYSQFHVIFYRNSKVPEPKELQRRYHRIDAGFFCRVISSHMREEEYVGAGCLVDSDCTTSEKCKNDDHWGDHCVEKKPWEKRNCLVDYDCSSSEKCKKDLCEEKKPWEKRNCLVDYHCSSSEKCLNGHCEEKEAWTTTEGW